MDNHPAADAFPMMDNNRYKELLEDIREHGQREAITTCDGMILDGRNRYKACLELGIEPITRVFNDDPWSYVWSLNGQRRDLVGEQRYLIWKFCYEQSEAFKAKKKRIQEEANRKRSEAQKGIPKDEMKERVRTDSPKTYEPSPSRAWAGGRSVNTLFTYLPGSLARAGVGGTFVSPPPSPSRARAWGAELPQGTEQLPISPRARG